MSVAERVAGQDEFGGADGHRRNSQFFKGCSEEARTEAFSVRSEAIVQRFFRKQRGSALQRVVEKILSQEAKIAGHTFGCERVEAQFAKDIEMDVEKMLRFAECVITTAVVQRGGDREKAVGYTLHGRNNHHDTWPRGCFADQAARVEHAFGSKQRTAAKLESENFAS